MKEKVLFSHIYHRILFIIFSFSLSFFSSSILAENATTTVPAPNTGINSAPQKYSIQITSPVEEETFQNATQSLAVSMQVTPSMKPDDKIILYVDGEAVDEPGTSTTIVVPWLPRGSHTLKAKIIPLKGAPAESKEITIYQQRTSLLLPAS